VDDDLVEAIAIEVDPRLVFANLRARPSASG
jgi:hypothetical protein